MTHELPDNYKATNAALAEAGELALKQPITGRQYVLMTDASFRASGNALMIEEDNDRKLNSRKTIFAPVAFEAKMFSPAQLKMSIFCNLSDLSRISRIQPNLVGNNNTFIDWQQVGNTQNKSDLSHTM